MCVDTNKSMGLVFFYQVGDDGNGSKAHDFEKAIHNFELECILTLPHTYS
jgi:hypothetical protein